MVEHDGYPAHRLRAGDLEARFVPTAGMIGVSLRHHHEELLGQRAGLDAYVTNGKTMGIPLLHPWANRLSGDAYEVAGVATTLPPTAPRLRRDPNGLPIHGLLAASPHWRVHHADDRQLDALFDFPGADTEDDLNALFPFPHVLAVAAHITPQSLSITTTLTPTSDRPVPIAFGWHPYFQLPDSPRERWELRLPQRRHLLTNDEGIPTGETVSEPPSTTPLDDTAYDHGYDDLPQPATFALTDRSRTITVTFDQGYPAAQVFAPPQQHLVAIEPMTAPTDALRSGNGLRLAQPGTTFAARFTIAVS